MKKAFSIVTMLFAALFFLCGCGKNTLPDDTSIIDGTQVYPATTPNPPICEVHQYEETVITMPGVKTEGMMKYTCKVCHSQYLRKIPPTNSIKILAIGNSFSSDAVEYLWDICDAAGIEDIVIGSLYIGGCSLDTHWSNMEGDKAAYQYYLNDFGTWKSSKKSIRAALESEGWDIITIQQVSQDSGRPETFGNLDHIIDYINEHKTNEYARIYWHMTWAYQSDSTHSGFANYGGDQMRMYDSIVNATKDVVLKTEYIAGVIPSGTAIQNLRTSTVGDTLTRDGYHMSYDLGRYTAALTWFKTLTGLDIDSIDWMPKAYADSIRPNLEMIREAVGAAVEMPFEVTESSRKPEITPPKTLTDADKQILRDLGLNPEDYTALDWEPVLHPHWNSVGGSTRQTIAGNPSSKIMTYYNSSKLFSKSELPNGTVIVVDDGYQYRPEGWTSLSAKNTAQARPANVTTSVVIVDSAWWGSFNYRAFNLSHVGATTNMTESDSAHLRIYVPKA